MDDNDRYRIVKVAEADAIPDDLDESELLGMSVALNAAASHSDMGERCVYTRAWRKIQPIVNESQGWTDDEG